MSIIASGKITLVKNKGSSMEVSVYKNELEAVCAMIDNGTLGDNGVTYYGCPEHERALCEVEKQIAETRKCIAESIGEESKP